MVLVLSNEAQLTNIYENGIMLSNDFYWEKSNYKQDNAKHDIPDMPLQTDRQCEQLSISKYYLPCQLCGMTGNNKNPMMQKNFTIENDTVKKINPIPVKLFPIPIPITIAITIFSATYLTRDMTLWLMPKSRIDPTCLMKSNVNTK